MQTGCGDNLMSTNLGLSPGEPNGAHNYHFWSYHPTLCQFLWADGSAKPLTYDLDYNVLQALATRAGGEKIANLEGPACAAADTRPAGVD